MNIEHLLLTLAEKRPIFHSEADFQHAFAWEMQKAWPDAAIRFEYKPVGIRSRVYLDIWTDLGNKKIAIELKYKTKQLEMEYLGEYFALANHYAHDCGRYDFLKDVQRLEHVVAGGQDEIEGYAIFVTNDSSYWSEGQSDTVDSAFRLSGGRKITGKMEWHPDAAPGTIRGREKPIRLRGTYDVTWKPFSSEKIRKSPLNFL